MSRSTFFLGRPETLEPTMVAEAEETKVTISGGTEMTRTQVIHATNSPLETGDANMTSATKTAEPLLNSTNTDVKLGILKIN
jgi:ribosomal protein S3